MNLGYLEAGTDRLEEAVSIFRSALDQVEWPGDQRPTFLGEIRHNLGLALLKIGERGSGLKDLRESADVLRAALKAERERPRSAAYIQLTLGEVLTRLAERDGGEQHLEEAANLTKRAAETFSFPPALPDWVRATLAHATALTVLGTWKSRVELLEEAAGEIRSVWKFVSRKLFPELWIALQTRLAETLFRQGELDESSTAALHKSVSVLRGALDEGLRRRAPGFWAVGQNSLGVASLRIAEREGDAAWAQAAEEAFRNALQELSRKEASANWAAAKHGLGSALVVQGSLQRDKPKYEAAITCFHDAAGACTRQDDRVRWAYAQRNLAAGLIGLSAFQTGTMSLEEAVQRLRTVLCELTPDSPPKVRKAVQETLDDALSKLESRGGADGTPAAS
jgi:tetratricopeptide (TPR) repeat protein